MFKKKDLFDVSGFLCFLVCLIFEFCFFFWVINFLFHFFLFYFPSYFERLWYFYWPFVRIFTVKSCYLTKIENTNIFLNSKMNWKSLELSRASMFSLFLLFKFFSERLEYVSHLARNRTLLRTKLLKIMVFTLILIGVRVSSA